jgi:hypothetical protein
MELIKPRTDQPLAWYCQSKPSMREIRSPGPYEIECSFVLNNISSLIKQGDSLES